MTVDREPANRASLEATLKRIMGSIRVDDRAGPLGPPIKCLSCKDTGVVEWIDGEFVSMRGLPLKASRERPVFTGCACRKRSAEEAPKSRRYSAA